jgi:hypothetical protein
MASSNEALLNKIVPPPESALHNEANCRNYVLCSAYALENLGELTLLTELQPQAV